MNLTVVHTTTGIGGVLGGTTSTTIDDSTANFLKEGIHFPNTGSGYTFLPWSQIINITGASAFNVDFA